MTDIIIYGAGGHAKVIIDIIEQSGRHSIAGLVDDTGSVRELMGYPVASTIGCYLDRGIASGVVAIGDNWLRCQVAQKILAACCGFQFVTAVHPSARLARGVEVGAGTVVMAGCNINPAAGIGRHCIINTGTNVDHDCRIGDFASLAPGVTLGGNVTVGSFSAIGLGASLIQKMTIGCHSVVGAGSVVTRPLPDLVVAYGVPCKAVRERTREEGYL